MQRNKLLSIIAGVVVLVAIVAGIDSAAQVGTGQVGVVTNLGKVTGRELGEGLSFTVPFVEEVTIYDTRVQKEDNKSWAATKDLQQVSSTIVLNYHLKRDMVSEMHQSVGKEFASKIIDPALSETFKAAAAEFNAGDLITNRAVIKDKVVAQLQDRLEKRGIVVDDVSITDFSFSDEFTKAVESKQAAQQDAERAKFKLEAAKTDAEAQRAQAETLTDAYLRKMAIEKWDGKSVPQALGGNTFLGLNFAKP